MTSKQIILLFLSGFLLTSCSPHLVPPGEALRVPRLTDNAFHSFDGTELPLKTWLPDSPPVAVLIALHGFNDYSNFIKEAAAWFRERNIAVYSYDQRCFGGSPHRGRWSGHAAMTDDLRVFSGLVQKRHPGVPLYLLGDSMGGAVLMASETADHRLPGDGVILVAPAVWSRTTMPFYQRWLLWLAVRIMPWAEVSGEGLDVTASDNDAMLRELGRDPLVIKKTRIDAVYGLVNLMDAAYEAANRFDHKALFLYGARDEIIPPGPMADVFRQRLQGHHAKPQRLLVYKDGFHMLLRDLQAEKVWGDILLWMHSPDASFASIKAGTATEITAEEKIASALFQKSSEH